MGEIVKTHGASTDTSKFKEMPVSIVQHRINVATNIKPIFNKKVKTKYVEATKTKEVQSLSELF